MKQPEKEVPGKAEPEKNTEPPPAETAKPDSASAPTGGEVATLGAGCFWCIEAVLEQIKGVSDVTSGYMGGAVPDPTYEQICTGLTGHAEVVQITFNPAVIDFAGVLEHFWTLHDPTTLNQQGNDVGTQYRSAIFYHSAKQKEIAEQAIRKKNEAEVF
ncbi:MAG: peptide-methionine (S)-S-oxide reductase MsrA, partial [Planctomycetota bacterium]